MLQRGINPLQTCVPSPSVYESPPRIRVGTTAVLWSSVAHKDWIDWAAQRPRVNGGSKGLAGVRGVRGPGQS